MESSTLRLTMQSRVPYRSGGSLTCFLSPPSLKNGLRDFRNWHNSALRHARSARRPKALPSIDAEALATVCGQSSPGECHRARRKNSDMGNLVSCVNAPSRPLPVPSPAASASTNSTHRPPVCEREETPSPWLGEIMISSAFHYNDDQGLFDPELDPGNGTG
jgi:hypothetical protein